MKLNISYVVGFLVGLLLVFIAFSIIGYLYKKKTGISKFTFDERQTLSRGKAYKHAFYVSLAYQCAYGLFDMATGIKWCDPFTGIMIGVCLSASVFAISCILNDAYLSLKENPKRYIILFTGLGLINLGIGAVNASNVSKIVENGKLQYPTTNFIVSTMIFIILIVFIAKTLIDKKHEGLE